MCGYLLYFSKTLQAKDEFLLKFVPFVASNSAYLRAIA